MITLGIEERGQCRGVAVMKTYGVIGHFFGRGVLHFSIYKLMCQCHKLNRNRLVMPGMDKVC